MLTNITLQSLSLLPALLFFLSSNGLSGWQWRELALKQGLLENSAVFTDHWIGEHMTQLEQMAMAIKGIGSTLEEVLALLDADDVPASREQIECLLCWMRAAIWPDAGRLN